MSQSGHKQAQLKADRHSFYTYVYGSDPTRSSRCFYATQDEAREDVVAYREALLREPDREKPLQDMAIVRFDTVPITPASLTDLFNDLDGQTRRLHRTAGNRCGNQRAAGEDTADGMSLRGR